MPHKNKPVTHRIIDAPKARPDGRPASSKPSTLPVANDELTQAEPHNTPTSPNVTRLRFYWDQQKESLGLTQVMAALYLGEPNTEAVDQYLNGERKLTLKAALRFARLLQVRPWDLVPSLHEMLGFIEDQVTEEAGAQQSAARYQALTVLQAAHEGIQNEVEVLNLGDFPEFKRLIMEPVTRYIAKASAAAIQAEAKPQDAARTPKQKPSLPSNLPPTPPKNTLQ